MGPKISMSAETTMYGYEPNYRGSRETHKTRDLLTQLVLPVPGPAGNQERSDNRSCEADDPCRGALRR